MKPFRTLLAALAACTALASAASAQPAPRITGNWVLDAPLDPDRTCRITGRARVTADGEEYNVRLSVREVCEGGDEYGAEQQCRGQRQGDKLWIDCTLISSTTTSYVDDDFALRIESGERMQGWLISARNGRATWTRPAPARIS